MLYGSEKEALAYIAGFLDGEGTITLSKQRARSKYSTSVCISQKHPLVILEIAEFLGAYYNIKVKVYQNSCNDMWMLGVYSRGDIQRFLRIVTPYLREKHRQAELLVAYIEYRDAEGKFGHTFENEEEDIFTEIRELNGGGAC